MANEANLLFERTFEGSLGDPWPGFVFGSGNPSFSQPRLDGKGKGIGSLAREVGAWRAKSTGYPGRSNYKADLWAKWKNPGFSGERGVGLIVRFRAYDDCLIARLTSKGTSNPELELVRVTPTKEQILGTYSGAGLGSALLQSGVAWRCRVEDGVDDDGNSKVEVFSQPTGATSDGTLRISWTGPLGTIRGNYGVGVELTRLLYNDDARVDSLEVYDFADEWVAPSPSAGGNGWQVAIDGTTYDVTDEDDAAIHAGIAGKLEGLDPPVYLETVAQGYGPGGNRCTLKTSGFTGGIVKPNAHVVVFYDGDEVFAGRVTSGQQTGSAGDQSQTWNCRDGFWLARNVLIEEDDCTGVRHYNVADEQSENYRDARQDMTLGAVLIDLFDEYADGDAGLRFYGAAPGDGSVPYVATELSLLDAVVHDLAISANFAAAVEQIVSLMPNVQVWIDPRDLVWHFRDVTALSNDPIVFDSEWASVQVEPSPEDAFTRIRYRGVRKETQEGGTLEYSTASRTLTPAWTADQEANYTNEKKSFAGLYGPECKIVIAANAPFPAGPGQPPTALVYIDVPASLGIDPDDLIGGICSVSGDAYTRFVVGNTSTRIWLGSPLWGGGTPPPPGSSFNVSAKVADGAIPALMAQGVGRAFFLPPVSLCPGFMPGGANAIKNGGICGTARVEYGKDGRIYSDEYKAKVHFSSAMQSSGGSCTPVLELAEKPKPAVGLVNFLPPASSLAKSACETGSVRADMPQVKVTFDPSTFEEDAPCFYYPEDESFAGDAFDEWGVETTFPFDDDGFTKQSQKDDFLPVARALHAVLSQKTIAFTVKLGTPWKNAEGIIRPPPTTVSRWYGLAKAISLSSSRRSMPDFESPNSFPVYEVLWNIRGRETILKAGTASGWLGINARTLTRELRKQAVEKKIAAAIQTLEDYRNRLNEKALKVERGGPAPDACEIDLIDRSEKRVVSVEKKFEDDQKVLSSVGGMVASVNDLLFGEENLIPGDRPKRPGDADDFVVDGGPVLGPAIARPEIPFSGARDDVVNARRGRYGGTSGVDSPSWGGPVSGRLMRRGGLGFRLKENAQGQPVGIEAATVNADGSFPTTGFVEITKPQDVPDSLGVPLEAIPGGESLLGRLISKVDGLNAALGRTNDALANHVEAGDDVGGGDRAPADLPMLVENPALSSGLFEYVPGSKDDAGGHVFRGPISKTPEGVEFGDVDRFWRVLAPENVLIEVEDVGAGGGTLGGKWSPKLTSGHLRFVTHAHVVHKNAEGGSGWSRDGLPLAPELPGEIDGTHPFGGGSAAAAEFAESDLSGFVFDFDLPPGVTGRPLFHAIVGEDPNNLAAIGTTWDFSLEAAYQASPWTAPHVPAGSTGTLTSDGSGTTQGVFMGPGDAVPPGLRKVSGTVQTTGGTGIGSGSRARVHGFGVSVIVTDEGFLAVVREGMDFAEETTHALGMGLDSLELDVAVSTEPQIVREEGLDLHVGASWELNPVGDGDEGLALGVGVSSTITHDEEGLALSCVAEWEIL